MDKYFVAEDLMEMFKIGRSTAYNLMHRSDFPSIRIGKSIRVSETDLREWVARGGTEPRDA